MNAVKQMNTATKSLVNVIVRRTINIQKIEKVAKVIRLSSFFTNKNCKRVLYNSR